MRAISLWEPWASLMAMGAKRIETRDWQTSVRGEMAIHAAKRPFHPAQWPVELGMWLDRVGMKTWGYGCVVAVGQLVDCVPVEQIRDTLSAQERAFGNFAAGRYAWVFSDVRRLDTPIHAKGSQGFWNWEPKPVSECNNLQESRAILGTNLVNQERKDPANVVPTTIDEPPDWPTWEPPDEPVTELGYASHRQESPVNYTGFHSQEFVDAFNAGAQRPAPLVPGQTQKGEIPWMDGILIAWEVMTLLDDLCSRITIGGSLRRGKPIVGDIEVIAQPIDPKRFARRCDLLLERGRVALRLNKLGYRIAWSQREKCMWINGMPLDLFIVQPDRQWGPTCLIRTGPNAANQVLVTKAGLRTTLGDVGILPHHMKFDDGLIWRDDEPLDCPEEKHVFAACGLPWVSPWLRTVAYYQRAAKLVSESLRINGVKPMPGQPLEGDIGPRKEWGWARSPVGLWYRLEAAELLRRRPALGAEIESLKIAGETIEQGVLM